MRTATRPRSRIAALPTHIAVDIYRIAQECLTNAVKHGSPTEIRLKVEYPTQEKRAVSMVVEDNGGGDAIHFNKGDGHGISGMRERIVALGGQISIGNAASGIRVAALIPVIRSNGGLPAGATV